MKVERVSREEVIGVDEAYTKDQEHEEEGLEEVELLGMV